MTEISERNAIFISHATPEQNPFTIWLAAKLTSLGYEVWADALQLIGGNDWQRKLENGLREKAFKVLLVASPLSVSKQGVRNEIQIASDVGRKIGDPEFIIPLRMEPFEAPFLIAHAQYIDFTRSWAAGLKELLEALQSYNVPKAQAETSALWKSLHLVAGRGLVEKNENLVSNWLPFTSFPETLYYYDFRSGISVGLAQRAKRECCFPLSEFKRGFLSFTQWHEIQQEMGDDLPIQVVSEIATLDFLESGWQDQNIARKDARKIINGLLSEGIEILFEDRHATKHEMANKRLAWFFAKDQAPASQISFNFGDRFSGRRKIINYSNRREVWWHYGVTTQVVMWPKPHIKLRGRLLFTSDGTVPLESDAKMHRLRRSFPKGWRNARWRDMMLAFLWHLADGKDVIEVPFGEGLSATLDSLPLWLISPVSVQAEAVPDPSEAEVEDDDDPIFDDGEDSDVYTAEFDRESAE